MSEQERKPRQIRVGFRREKPARLPDGSRVEVGGGVLRWTPPAPEIVEALSALRAWRAAVLADPSGSRDMCGMLPSDTARHRAQERLLQAANAIAGTGD